MIKAVFSHEIDDVWPRIEKWVSDACEYTDVIDAQDVLNAIRERRMQCFLADDKGVFVTEVQMYPRKKVLRVVSLGGSDLDSWLPDVTNLLDDWAREIGAKVECTGRKGWVRKLAQYGWREASVTCERIVT